MVRIVKASRYTFAKKGYLVFAGQYPTMKMKYSSTKRGANVIAKRWRK